MSSCESPDHRISALDLNSDLQQVQVDLLSAQCAVHQLRLHYSSDDLARFGRRDVLRKSAEAAGALHQFFTDIEKKIPAGRHLVSAIEPTGAQIQQGIEWVSEYLLEQREHYAPVAGPLPASQKSSMWPYFSAALLDRIRFIELQGARVKIPKFFDHVRALGFEPPPISHMDSLTFLDVIVFNQYVSERALLHALVHAVQIQILGVKRYADLWVRSFAKTRTHFTVPLEVQAFSLASKFSRGATERFSVEDEVLRWLSEDRY
jgi:hypothetical protein